MTRAVQRLLLEAGDLSLEEMRRLARSAPQPLLSCIPACSPWHSHSLQASGICPVGLPAAMFCMFFAGDF